MASEIRVNTFKNRSGLGTITVNDTGANFSGVVTATSFSGDGSSLTSLAPTQIVTGNTSVQTVDTGSDGHVKVTTEGTERVRITSFGSLSAYTTDTGGHRLRSSSASSANLTALEVLNSATSTTDGTVVARIRTNGDIQTDGNIILSTSGAGIDFSATSDAGGMSSELLDDYEEGTYTPVLSGGGYTYTSGSYTEGRYTKVGRIVTVEAHYNISAISGSSDGSATRITLPFAPSQLYTAGRWCQVLCRLVYFNASAIQRVYCAQLTTNSSSADIVYYYTSSSSGTDQPVNIGADWQSASTNGQIAFTMTYVT